MKKGRGPLVGVEGYTASWQHNFALSSEQSISKWIKCALCAYVNSYAPARQPYKINRWNINTTNRKWTKIWVWQLIRIMALKTTTKWFCFTFERRGNVKHLVKITGGKNTNIVFENQFFRPNSQHLPLACHTYSESFTCITLHVLKESNKLHWNALCASCNAPHFC